MTKYTIQFDYKNTLPIYEPIATIILEGNGRDVVILWQMFENEVKNNRRALTVKVKMTKYQNFQITTHKNVAKEILQNPK